MSILRIAEDARQKEGASRIDRVLVRIGNASGVMIDSLRFSFEYARAEFPAARGAELLVEEIPVGGRCAGCAGSFTVEGRFVFNCPLCGSEDFSITSGNELDVLELEVN